NFAVSVFGTNDKAALVVGIVVVSLLLGAVLGPLTVQHGWVGTTGFVAFAVVGVVAGLADPQTSKPSVVAAAVAGAAAGIAALFTLLRLAPRPPAREVTVGPGPGVGSRRAFLAAVAGAGAFAVAAGAGGRAFRAAAATGRAALR